MRRTPAATGSPSASSNRRARSRRVARTLPAAATAAPVAARAPVAASARGAGAFVRLAILSERLVLIARVVGDLATEPGGRKKRLRRLLVRELHLDDEQSIEVSPVGVELERQAAGPRDEVPALTQAASGRERPQALEAVRWDRELLLRSHAPGALLDGHHGVAAGAADAHLGPVRVDRDVALVELSRRVRAQVIRRLCDEPLALDLRHQGAADTAGVPSRAREAVASSARSSATRPES